MPDLHLCHGSFAADKRTRALTPAGALWYVLGARRVGVRHLLVICLVTLSLFMMLWFGTVVAGLSAAETTAASGLTVVLIGVGLLATRRGLRRPPSE